jgi:3-dehydrosphinganine reductase
MHVIVTGGSSGIGLEVARIYAGRGASVSILARNPVPLEAARLDLEGRAADVGRIFAAAADVAAGDELSRAIAACEAALGPCDVVVACAGIVEPAWFHDQPADVFDGQWRTNFVGVVDPVRLVYAGMRARGQGRIMIVSSAAALVGIPAYAAYCASKSALVGFADALRLETVPGVTIGICFPPDTDTPQFARELQSRPREAEILMGKIRPRPAPRIAEAIVAGIDRGAARVYFSLPIAALAMFAPLLKPWIELWYRLRAGRRLFK